MKQSDFSKFNDGELYIIRNNLITYKTQKLPKEIQEYINPDTLLIGNLHTRIMRCISLIDHEIVDRFVNKFKQ
jgi:hypothetical protein